MLATLFEEQLRNLAAFAFPTFERAAFRRPVKHRRGPIPGFRVGVGSMMENRVHGDRLAERQYRRHGGKRATAMRVTHGPSPVRARTQDRYLDPGQFAGRGAA